MSTREVKYKVQSVVGQWTLKGILLFSPPRPHMAVTISMTPPAPVAASHSEVRLIALFHSHAVVIFYMQHSFTSNNTHAVITLPRSQYNDAFS